MKLTICVVTMNRAEQLKEALRSCLMCELPRDTEFVVLDNASTDNTEQAAREVLENCGYGFKYERVPENLGVGGGRNYAYGMACGEYTYMLDDDAVIDVEKNPNFFVRAIDTMDKNRDIVTLTTQIYDTAWKSNRVERRGSEIASGVYKCYMFCGGSHFLRRDFYRENPYLSNKYGYEEIPPSLDAVDCGKINAFCPELLIIHKPARNKWDWNDEKNHELLVKGIALPYAIKSMMYPAITRPMLFMATKMRIKRLGVSIKNFDQRVKCVKREFIKEYPINKKIKLSTVMKMFVDFKLSIF